MTELRLATHEEVSSVLKWEPVPDKHKIYCFCPFSENSEWIGMVYKYANKFFKFNSIEIVTTVDDRFIGMWYDDTERIRTVAKRKTNVGSLKLVIDTSIYWVKDYINDRIKNEYENTKWKNIANKANAITSR